jgi:putative peptide zinc metalloprotease protein
VSAGKKLPSLRTDLKISRQVLSGKVGFVVKDPIKGEYFRFSEVEWRIIQIFDGEKTPAEAMADFNSRHPLDPIDVDVIGDFESSLNEMNLLEKSKQEMNVMLIEKMKETRKSMLLSKEGSLMYKRFPLVDPDRMFNRVIPHLWFFWTKGFFLFSSSIMLFAMILVGYRFDEFSNGVFEIFSFSKLSFWNLAFLWITIYSVIAIHELGHGLTCKRYGGEVHEIGFLLLFFQPCLYANVNDAWLFDKKWKQVMVTVAGGYIEFFVGALFGILWAVTNPNTMINVLSLQVMTICSVSTVLFNFNPLVKLDGYYLLADFLEVPNLRDSSFGFLKSLISTKIFRMEAKESDDSTNREKRIFLIYGIASFFWVASTTFGLFLMAKGMLIESLHATGVLISFWVAYKLFGGHVKKSGGFLLQWFLKHREALTSRRGKVVVGVVGGSLVLILFFPVPYRVPGKCVLESTRSEIIRAGADGVIRKFTVNDGAPVIDGNRIFEIENPTITTDLEIARIQLMKVEMQSRAAIHKNLNQIASLTQELTAKREAVGKLLRKIEALQPRAETRGVASVASCPDQTRKLNSFVKEGDEVCRLHTLNELKAIIEISEHDVSFIKLDDQAHFRLEAQPLKTYEGRVTRIQSSGVPDPTNPKARLYRAELVITNPGDLRPGMTGLARVNTGWVTLGQYLGRFLASFFRLDLFF